MKVLESGLGLISAQGYSQIGVDKICEHTGMTKGAFYNAFKSKEKFLILALESYGESTVARITRTLAPEGDMSAIERLEAYYVGMLTYQPQIDFMGCMVNNIMSELGATNELVAACTSVQFESFIQALIPTVKAAQAEGEMDANADPKDLAELMHSTFYGSLTRARGLRGAEQGVQTMQLLLKALKPHD